MLTYFRLLLKSSNWTFAAKALEEYWRFFLNLVQPIEGEIPERIHATVKWITRAANSTQDGGVSYGYFPLDGGNGWKPSYPETTGYLITTLLEYARSFSDESTRRLALRMARWEMEIQMSCGAIPGGMYLPHLPPEPVVFNTGMVLGGWSSAYRETRDEGFLQAGRKAASFLMEDLDEECHFRTHGPFVVPGRIKTYHVLCAWPLYQFGEDAGDFNFRNAAIKIAEAVLQQQASNGWFANNCLDKSQAPLTHTIGYTLQGLLEVGFLCGREDFVLAVRNGMDPLISKISSKGFLPGRFYSDWSPATWSSCLTGSAQLAVVCYRLYLKTKDSKYYIAGNKLLNYLKSLQVINSKDENINGTLAGSFPFFGDYMRAGYPNWAAKYLLDALMLQHSIKNKESTGLG